MDFGADIKSLVQRAQENDADAFGEIFDLFLTPIYRFVFFRVGTKEDAEDITEEVFLKAWKNLKSFQQRRETPFSAWLFQIAKNTLTDFYRQKKDVAELSEEETDERYHQEIIQNADRDFERKRLLVALKEIPELQADAVSLKFFSDLSNAEIASVLKKSEGAVRILLSRGIKRLREIFDLQEGGETKSSQNRLNNRLL